MAEDYHVDRHLRNHLPAGGRRWAERASRLRIRSAPDRELYLGRLGHGPKHQLADPALAARAVGVGSEALLTGLPAGIPDGRESTFLGRLFEALIIQSLRIYAQPW